MDTGQKAGRKLGKRQNLGDPEKDVDIKVEFQAFGLRERLPNSLE